MGAGTTEGSIRAAAPSTAIRTNRQIPLDRSMKLRGKKLQKECKCPQDITKEK